MRINNNDSGWIEMICGPMFRGKTEELIRRLKRALIANNSLKIFKPFIDDRYSETHIVSHNNNSIESELITNINDILVKSKKAQVIGIDEVQFFDNHIIKIANKIIYINIKWLILKEKVAHKKILVNI